MSARFEARPRDGGFGIWDLQRACWLEQPGMRLAYWWPGKAHAEEYAAKRRSAGRPSTGRRPTRP